MKPDEFAVPKKVSAAAVKRPKTNLVPSTKYALTREQMKTGFMGVFNWAYSGDPRATLIKLALAPLLNTTVIPLGKRPSPKTAEERQQRKADNATAKEWNAKRKDSNLNQFTSLKKVNGADPHFILDLPILHLNSAIAIDQILNMLAGVTMPEEARAAAEEWFDSERSHIFPASLALGRSGLPNNTKVIFSTCLQGVKYQSDGRQTLIFLEFKISQAEAEALVSTDWLELRPVDLYPLFTMWVSAEYVSRNYGKTATSLSRIAGTLPAHLPEDVRIDSHGVGITLDGEPIWLPLTCDQTQKYESMFVASNSGQGTEFALRSIANPDHNPPLPADIPILVDWVNCKFTYSDRSGKPVIMPLEHVRKCNSSMAMHLMQRPLPEKFVFRLQSYAKVCNVPVDVSKYGASTDRPMTITEYADAVVLKLTQEHSDYYPKYIHLTSEVDKEIEMAGWLPVIRFVRALQQGMKQHLEAVYAQYAISTTIELLGWLTILVEYGGDIDNTRVQADTINKIPKSQGIDPNWAPPAAPLVTEKFGVETGGMLPHQAKIRNIMRESPDNAMLSVDAGGGKSMLSITDVLYEIKVNRSAPYLIMCPSHLVANYVAEIVEFTDGQVNVIPVTSYNIRTSGIARFEAILRDAPINTILVVDYDVLKFRAAAMVYGTSSIAVYPVIEMIRQFKPGYCMLDESHFLRNVNSARTKSVMNLITDIPKKRLASGTINPDSPSDLPGQVAILDPTIFGTRDEFNNTYGEKVSGNRVMKWRTKGPNSTGEVMTKLKGAVVWAQAKRKEWACALPTRHDYFAPVELTPNQRIMYKAIFDDMIQQIRQDAKNNKNAKKLLEKLEGKKAAPKDEEDFGDLAETPEEDEEEDALDDSSDVGAALQPYLADIERFVTDPSSHPYSKNGIILSSGQRVEPLTGDDLKSPKALELAKILTNYLADHEAKAIVFVNYNQSADSLFAAMPPELQEMGLLYKASSKVEMVNRFKTDKKIRWMIGIRKSLEVGLNLQIAGCLIRMEGVWTPGEQEQGDSRISRPYFGPGGDKRKDEGLWFFTIVADQTLDITKAARLRAKIVALAKFENTGNPDYEAIEDIPVIPMNLDTIKEQNDFRTNLKAYQTSMSHLNAVIKAENEEYKEKIIAEGGFKFTQIQKAPTPPEAALLARVPYAQGTELYSANELGLVRVDNYLGMELSGEDDEDESGGGGDDGENDNSAEVAAQKAIIMGLRAHCEFGDGYIVGAGAIGKTNFIGRVVVKLDDGTTAPRLRATNVFIVTRTETNSVDMRNKLAQAAGLNITAPITVPGVYIKQTRVTLKEQRELELQRQLEEQKKAKQDRAKGKSQVQKGLSIGLELSMVNGYLRFSYIQGDDPRAVKALEALGFKIDPHYYYARIRSYKHLIKQAEMWAEGGFEITSQVDNDTFQILADELAKGSLQSHRHYERMISRGNFQNYLRRAWKPSANKMLLNMFALVTDGGDTDAGAVRQAAKAGVDPNYGVAYLCLPAGAGQPASKLAISAKYKAPATRWLISQPTLSVFVGNMAGVHQVLNQIREAGITINNVDELNKQAKSVKRVSPKNDETVDMRIEELDPNLSKKMTKVNVPKDHAKVAELERSDKSKVRAVPPRQPKVERAVPPTKPKVTTVKKKIVPKTVEKVIRVSPKVTRVVR